MRGIRQIKMRNISVKMKDINNWFATVFLLILFLIPIATLLGGASTKEVVSAEADAVLENNGTAEKQVETEPKEETGGGNDKVSAFSKMQNSVNDFTQRLFLRPVFIEGNTKLTKTLTGNTYMESTQVLLGKENWLFYKTQNDGYPIYDYMGINQFTETQLKAIADNLIAIRDYFEKEKGVLFVAATIPNKEIVYEEYMPDTIARVNTVSRGEQLAAYIQANTDLRYVYPKQAFLEQKEEYPLYYKTDTHWNHIGAFVGVQEIFKELYGYGVTPDTVYFHERQNDFAGDLSVIAGVSEQYKIDTVYEFDYASVNPGQKRDENAIVVGDSFGGFLSVIAKGYYNQVYWINTDDFRVSMLDEYDADVIIWETVERHQEIFMNKSLIAEKP